MTKHSEIKKPLIRIAIVGAGPSGFYTAGQLLNEKNFSIEVDMFDRLPTPYGLVRGGVAPDHQKIKSVTKVFERIAQKDRFRFYGNVEFGTHIKLEDLQTHYHQIVFATGAQSGKRLNIPGAELQGSYPASDFVAWYNAHPDYRDLTFDLSQEQVAVIGIGNVALDVARILCHTPEELHKTDIADYALEALRQSRVKEVYLLGRRGPAQAAFTPPEIVELGQLSNLDIAVPRDEAQLDPLSQADMDANPDRATLKNIETLQAYANLPPNGKPRQLNLRFLVSPVEIFGNPAGQIIGLQLVKNELYRTEGGTLRPRPTQMVEDIPAGLIFHSIGYRGVALPGIPFNDRWGIIPNQNGRVILEDGSLMVGIYSAGWIKRGPSGVIGTNKLDATETVAAMLADLQSGVRLNPVSPTAASAEKMIYDHQPRHLVFTDWLHLDQIEIERGTAENRPRIKFSVVEEMLSQLNI